jgi:hypothetical protein
MRTTIGISMLSIAGLAGCAAAPNRTADEVPPPHPPELVTTAATSALDVTKRPAPNLGIVTMRASVDDVWAALRATYEELGIPVTTLDLPTRTLGNGELKVRRRLGTTPLTTYIDCGDTQGGRSAETYEVMLSIYSQIQSAGPNTNRVRSSFQAMARPVSISSDYRRCQSTGALEKRFGELLRKHLGM